MNNMATKKLKETPKSKGETCIYMHINESGKGNNGINEMVLCTKQGNGNGIMSMNKCKMDKLEYGKWIQ